MTAKHLAQERRRPLAPSRLKTLEERGQQRRIVAMPGIHGIFLSGGGVQTNGPATTSGRFGRDARLALAGTAALRADRCSRSYADRAAALPRTA